MRHVAHEPKDEPLHLQRAAIAKKEQQVKPVDAKQPRADGRRAAQLRELAQHGNRRNLVRLAAQRVRKRALTGRRVRLGARDGLHAYVAHRGRRVELADAAAVENGKDERENGIEHRSRCRTLLTPNDLGIAKGLAAGSPDTRHAVE